VSRFQRLTPFELTRQGRNATVHMLRIGCGLAGGRWDAIEPIIERTLCNNEIECSSTSWNEGT
jgi:hypothetical protein